MLKNAVKKMFDSWGYTIQRKDNGGAQDIGPSGKTGQLFFEQLLDKTGNFSQVTWLGKPIWQNILDLWIIQETIWELHPALLIECGTNRGGSAYYYAQIFDLIGKGKVVTVDVEKMHDLVHPRVEFLIGSSTSNSVIERVRAISASVRGPIMVILDSDHSMDHVLKELELYSSFVTSNSYMLVQDGVIDVLPRFAVSGPGPLPAIKEFLEEHPEFEVEEERCERFLISHHPMGWLKRTT